MLDVRETPSAAARTHARGRTRRSCPRCPPRSRAPWSFRDRGLAGLSNCRIRHVLGGSPAASLGFSNCPFMPFAPGVNTSLAPTRPTLCGVPWSSCPAWSERSRSRGPRRQTPRRPVIAAGGLDDGHSGFSVPRSSASQTMADSDPALHRVGRITALDLARMVALLEASRRLIRTSGVCRWTWCCLVNRHAAPRWPLILRDFLLSMGQIP